MKGPMARKPTNEMFPPYTAKTIATVETQTGAHQGRDRLGAVRSIAPGSRLKFLFAWFGHCPPSGARVRRERYSSLLAGRTDSALAPGVVRRVPTRVCSAGKPRWRFRLSSGGL